MAIRYKGGWRPDKFLKIPKTFKKFKVLIHFADGKSMWLWHYQTDQETGQMMYLGKEVRWKPVFGKANMIANNITPEAIVPLEEIGTISKGLGRVNFCWQKTDGIEIASPYINKIQSDLMNKSWENRTLKSARANVFSSSRTGIIDPQEAQNQHTQHVSKLIKDIGPRPEFGIPKSAIDMIRPDDEYGG